MTSDNSNSTHEGIQLSAEERLRYRQPDTARLAVDLALPWLQAIIGCAIFIAYPSVWTWLIAIFVIGGAQHGLSLIGHEGSHRTLCPQDIRKNDLIATYLFAAPVVLPFTVYRQRHTLHHRLVSQLGDTEYVYRRDMRGWRFIAEIFRSLSGLDFLLKSRDALNAGKGEEFENFEANLRRDQISIILVHAVIFLVFFLFDPLHFGVPTYYFILWLWPVVTVTFLFAKLRALVEHQPPRTGMSETPESPYFMQTSGPMLRSVHATWFERLFLSKINFHYHAEHHLWPWISYQHLPEMNSRLWEGRERNEPFILNGNIMFLDDNYTAVMKDQLLGK